MSAREGLRPQEVIKGAVDEALYGGTGESVSGPPYIRDGVNVQRFLAMPVIAALPLLLLAIYFFSWYVVAMLATAFVVGMAVEGAFSVLRNRTPSGGSIVVLMLFTLLLPPGLPLYIVAIGAALAIFAKEIFGGLGFYLFNPALVGKAIIIIFFPVLMTSNWAMPYTEGAGGLAAIFPNTSSTAIAATTPLANDVAAEAIGDSAARTVQLTGNSPLQTRVRYFPSNEIKDMAMANISLYTPADMLIGRVPGALGTTSGLLLLLVGFWLLATRAINWRIALVIILTVGIGEAFFEMIFSDIFRGGALTHILAGSLLFTAFLVATDSVTSPMTLRGKLLYGLIIGLAVLVLRIHLPVVDPTTELVVSYRAITPDVEGVTFSVLLANLLVPFIDRITQPKPFGSKRGAA